MVDPSLGSESFIFFTGRVQPLGQRLQILEREGEDNQEYRTRGKRSTPTQHKTNVDVDTVANARALEATYKGMIGTIVTLTYADGQTFMNSTSNVTILDVQVDSIRVEETPVGGVAGGPVIVAATWTLQGTE